MSAPGSSAADGAADVAAKVERFVRETVFSYERDPRFEVHGHGPSDTLVAELRAKAREAGVLTPHVRADGSHFSQRDTATILKKSGLSPLGPVAVNTMAPRSEEHTSELQSLMRNS